MKKHPPPLVITGVRVITGTGDIIADADVIVNSGRIARIATGPALKPSHPGNAVTIDGRGRTLIPGLIDAHCHLDFLQCRGGLRARIWARTALPKALGGFVTCGITAIRTMADPPGLVFALHRRVARGKVIGPRLVSAGPALTAPGGHPEVTVSRDNPWLARNMVRRIRDTDDAIKAVRQLHRAGADLIKIVYQGGVYADQGVEIVKLPAPAARAIIEEAHRLGMPVGAHTHYEQDVGDLLEMGVDSLEHGISEVPIQDDDTLRLWSDRGTPLVPTLAISRDVRNASGEAYLEQATANLRAAHRAGVRIVAGTDSMIGAMPADTLHDELRLMVDAGLSPHEALQAATAHAAELLQLEGRGVVAEGAIADLVLLGSDPLQDIGNIGDIRLVLQGGKVVHRTPERRRVSLDRFTPPPADLDYRDTTGSADSTVRYSCAQFDETGTRTLEHRDPRTGNTVVTETIESDEHLASRRWTYDAPDKRTHLEAEVASGRIILAGTFEGKPVSRTYPLLGRTWLQGSVFDLATFITSDEGTLEYVALGTSGHGALRLTEFELTKAPRKAPDTTVLANLVIPRWRRWWSAELEFDSADGSLLVARMGPGKELTRVARPE